MKKSLATALAALSLVACQSASRKPASHSAQVQAEAISAYHQQNLLNLLEEKRLVEERKLENSDSNDDSALKVIEANLRSSERQLADWKQSLAQQANRSSVPVSSRLEYITPWRYQVEEFEVSNLNNFAFNSPQPIRNYFMASQGASTYELRLKQIATAPRGALASEISCDQPFEVMLDGRAKAFAASTVATFDWKHHEQKPRLAVRFHNQNSHCSLKFREQSSANWSGVNLRPEVELFKDLTRLTRQFQVCSLPTTANLTGVEKFFLTADYSSVTCPEQASFTLAAKPIEGLTERIRILTGSELPQSVIDTRNPFVELDYSRAPKLDLIVVTSLIFRSDFYGQLLARALVWHAQRGAIVRILNSKGLELKKDREMFRNMMAMSDNIKVQTYVFDSKSGIKGKINELHRVSHTKLFATYSRSQPEASVVIVGGRNVHEGYILPVAMERLGLPQLVDYVKGEDSYLFFRDVEAIVRSQSYAETTIAHLLTFWQRQPDAFTRSISLNLSSGAEADQSYFQSRRAPLVRHVLSLPYKDNRELNDLYADVIDSAQREIKITTPYFLPTKKVGKALERAIKRGVQITVITKTHISGDNPQFDKFTSASNQISVNKYWDKLRIYDYTVPNSLLHSKLMLVDGKLSIIGSVNLNRRSFYHDVENASIVYSPEFNQQLSAMFEEFLSLSKPVESGKRVGFLKRLIVSIINKEL